MNRSTIKALGFLLLIPFAGLELLPVLATHTNLLDGWGDTAWQWNGMQLLSIGHGADGHAHASVHPAFWAVAAAGEIMLVLLAMFRPVRTSRWVVTPNG